MKVDKYDRQIRLWGAFGQKRLCQSRIALLNCSGAGIEALKNLVLPGVGHIDIWDNRKIELQDLSGCFFYSHEDIGKFRAEVACANLLEMNADVEGEAFIKSPRELIEGYGEKFKQYSLVIVGDVCLDDLKLISKRCWEQSIAAVFVSVVGFFIYIRNQREIHTVQFQRTAAKKYYLRLHDPFPGLVEHSKQWNLFEMITKLQQQILKDNGDEKCSNGNEGQVEQRLEKQKNKEKAAIIRNLERIPYPVILMQLYHSLPEQQRNKGAIVQQIRKWEIMLGEGHRDNFTQAASRYLDLMQSPDNFLRGLDRFESQHVLKANSKSEPALIFLKACKKHLQKTGHLPQIVDLPDIETETKLYIELKTVYKAKHEEDLDALEEIIKQICDGAVPTALNRKTLSNFVNNIEALQVLTLQPYFAELQKANQGVGNQNLKWIDYQGDWRNLMLVLRAWLEFQNKEGRVPTLKDQDQVREIVDKFKITFGFDPTQQGQGADDPSFDVRYLTEILRVEGQTTISINSIAGALAGQQAIKLITHCFTPVKNGFVFNAVNGKGFSVQL